MKSLLKTVPFLLFTLILAACTFDKSLDQELQYKNLIQNGGFENARTMWTASGPGGATFSLESTAANVGKGKYSGSYTATAASQFLLNDGVDVPDGLKGRDCLATVVYKTAEATNLYDLVIHDAVSAVLASNSLATSASGFTKAAVSLTCPSSGKITAGLRATGNASTIYVDEFYLGENYLSSVIAGAGLVSSGANTLDVNPDNTTIEISSDQVKVKAIGTTEIADAAVTEAKMGGKTVYCSTVTSPGSTNSTGGSWIGIITTPSFSVANKAISVWIQGPNSLTNSHFLMCEASLGPNFQSACKYRIANLVTGNTINRTDLGGYWTVPAPYVRLQSMASLFSVDTAPGATTAQYQLQTYVQLATQTSHWNYLMICAAQL